MIVSKNNKIGDCARGLALVEKTTAGVREKQKIVIVFNVKSIIELINYRIGSHVYIRINGNPTRNLVSSHVFGPLRYSFLISVAQTFFLPQECSCHHHRHLSRIFHFHWSP